MVQPWLGPALADRKQPQPAPPLVLEIGSIAGTAAWPIYGWITELRGANYGKASAPSAHDHAQHNLTLRLAHSALMKAPKVIAACIRFLNTSHF